VVVLLEHARLEAALEEVADPVIAAVEADRVEAVQALQACRELRLGRPDDEVEVVRHQRPGVELPGVSRGDVSKQTRPGVTVERVEDDRAPLDSTRRHVVVRRCRELATGPSRHRRRP
jgi:predicted exporter